MIKVVIFVCIFLSMEVNVFAKDRFSAGEMGVERFAKRCLHIDLSANRTEVESELQKRFCNLETIEESISFLSKSAPGFAENETLVVLYKKDCFVVIFELNDGDFTYTLSYRVNIVDSVVRLGQVTYGFR